MLIRYEYGERKVWSVVRVPSPEEEDGRQLHRELRSLRKEKTRTTNRIRGLLATQGIRLESRMDLSDAQLEAIRLWNGKALPAALKSRLKREWEHVLFVKKQIQALEGERRCAMKKREGADKQQESADLDKVRQLAMLGGIGTHGSWVLVRELFGWRKFGNRRQVGSLSGLTPTPYQSGDSRREQGISHTGNCHVRDIAIELAWCWVRYQPESKQENLDQLAHLFHQRKPALDLHGPGHESRIEVDFVCADALAAFDIPLDLLERAGEDHALLAERLFGDLDVGAHHQFELRRVPALSPGHLLDAIEHLLHALHRNGHGVPAVGEPGNALQRRRDKCRHINRGMRLLNRLGVDHRFRQSKKLSLKLARIAGPDGLQHLEELIRTRAALLELRAGCLEFVL